MTAKESIELARYFAEQLGGSTRQLCFAGLGLIWLLNGSRIGTLSSPLRWAGALLLLALLVDYCHSIVGATWGGRVAWKLAGRPQEEHDATSLFRTLYSFLSAKCVLLLIAYGFLLFGLWRAANASG